MAILDGRHIVPPRTQATSRSPAQLGLIHPNTKPIMHFTWVLFKGSITKYIIAKRTLYIYLHLSGIDCSALQHITSIVLMSYISILR